MWKGEAEMSTPFYQEWLIKFHAQKLEGWRWQGLAPKVVCLALHVRGRKCQLPISKRKRGVRPPKLPLCIATEPEK